MPGKHITTDQIDRYRRYRKKHNRQESAAFAEFSIASAWLIDKGIHFRLKPAKPREARKKKLLKIWTEVALPYIKCHPGAPAKLVFDHVLSKGPGTGSYVSTSQRRSFERWYSRCKLEKGVTPNSKRTPSLIESYTLLRSAHQGAFEVSKLRHSDYPHLDLSSLLKAATSSSLATRNRALFILGVASTIPTAHIASYLMLGVSTISRWASKLRTTGPEQFLSPVLRTRPKRDSKDVRAALFKVLHSPPKSYGFPRTNWRAIDLKKAMQTEGVTTSLWTIRQIVRKEGYSWRKAKVSLTSNDPKYQEKVDRIKSILSILSYDEAFLSVDEYGPFSIRLVKGRKMVPPGVFPTVPQWQKSRGRLILTAALDLSTNQITHFYSKKKNTGEMIKMIDLIRRKSKGKSSIYFSWDAASWHMSKKLDKHVEFLNGWADYDGAPKVVLVPLPARAQFLNVIESVFSGMARAIIHNSDFAGEKEAKEMIDAYIDQRNSHFLRNPRKAGDKIWGRERLPPVFSDTGNFKDPRF
jgi:transposase